MEDNKGLDLKELIKKLGHGLQEVRQRAFRNLLSKLQNEIICIESILHYQELYVNLLQWINRKEEEEKVVEILAALAQFPSGCQRLLSLGGIEFFTNYHQELLTTGKTFAEVVDTILNSLFHHDSNIFNTEPSVHFTSPTTTAPDDLENQSKLKCMEILTNYNSIKSTTTTNMAGQQSLSLYKSDKSSVNCTKNDSCPTFHSQNSSLSFAAVSTKETFQWLPLTSGDRQILAVTESRLQSSSSDLIIQSCDFLRNVLLHDFPAEVFIQRPNIVKTLLSVVSINKNKPSDCIVNILQALTDMCRKLYQRFLQNQNNNIWQRQLLPEDIHSMSISTNQTQSSSLSSKDQQQQKQLEMTKDSKFSQPLHSADNNNINDTMSRDGTDVDDMESTIMTEALIQAQLSIQEYLINIMLATVDLLKLYIHHNELFTTVVMLHKHVLDLLTLIDMKCFWESSYSADKSIIYNVMTILSRFGDVSLSLKDPSDSGGDTVTEQEKELKSVILCKIVIGFMCCCVPMERLYEVIPENTSGFLKVILTKVSFLKELPELRKSLVKMLTHFDDAFIKDYNTVVAMVTSMRKLDEFFTLFKEGKNVSDKQILKLSNGILQSLHYHSHGGFMRKLLNICCERHVKEKEKTSQWKDLFLKILQQSTLEVKVKSYSIILEILKDALSDSLVSHPLSVKHQNAFLIIQKALLSQIALDCHHENERVRGLSASIICLIVSSQLNMSVSLSRSVISTIASLLPILQCNIGNSDTAYDSSLLSLLNQPQGVITAEGDFIGLPAMEHTRAVLRLMFHKVPKVRSKGFALSLVHLTNCDKENKKVVNYAKEDSIKPEDLFVFNARDLIGFQSTLTHFNSITVENVEKLWKVFKDELVDEGLRHSASYQLSVVLQDPLFHKMFIVNNEYKYILEQLSLCLCTKSRDVRISTNVVQKKFLISLIKMLKNLAYHQPVVRHLLSVNSGLYMQLLQAGFLFAKDYELRFYASSLLCLMLFDEVLVVDDNKSEVQLMVPECVLKNFRLPHDLTATLPDGKKSEQKVVIQCETIKGFIKSTCCSDMEWFQNDELHSQCSDYLQLTKEEKERYKAIDVKNIVKCMASKSLKPPNHFNAIESMNQLKLLFFVFHNPKCRGLRGTIPSEFVEEISSVFKTGIVRQILGVLPASEDDHKLFASVIKFIHTIIHLEFSNVFEDFEDLLMTPVITKMIQGIPYEDRSNSVTWARSLKQLVVTAISLLYSGRQAVKDSAQITATTTSSTTSTAASSSVVTTKLTNISTVIRTIYKTLSIAGSESYYDLPLMEFMLECLMHLLAPQKWSLQVEGGQAICIELFNWLAQILVSFHVDRVSAAVSFMGKGIVQKAAICLCHLIHEIKMLNGDDEWLKQCTAANDTSLTSQHSSILPVSSLPWLIHLLSDRLTDIRFCGWAISTALVCDKVGQQLVINEFQSLPGGLWAAALGVVLDDKECFAVRSQATALLTKLIQSTKFFPSENEETIWASIVVQDTSSKMEVSGINAFLLLLDHFKFFTEVRQILSSPSNNNINKSNYSNNTNLINASTSFSQSSVTENDDVRLSSSVSSSDDAQKSTSGAVPDQKLNNQIYVERNINDDKPPPSSPLFKKSLLQFVCKLIELSPQSIMKKLDEHQIISVILSSWVCEKFDPPQDGGGQIDATSSILCLLDLLHAKDAGKFSLIVEQYNIVTKLFQLLTPRKVKDLSPALLSLWNQCMVLLGRLCCLENVNIKTMFSQLVLKYLPELCDNLEIIMGNTKRKDSIKTLTLYLNFIILMLKDIDQNDSRGDNKDIAQNIDSIMTTQPHGSDIIISIGERLCKLLLELYGKNYVLKEPYLLKNAMQCVFICSAKAKECALENGFVETVIEELKDKLVKLNVVTGFEKSEDKETVKNTLLQDLCSIMDLIRNYMVKDENVKLAFLKSKLMIHLQHVWSWSQLHEELRISLLEMITVFAANCNEVSSTMCTVPSLPQKQTLDESSFVTYVIKLLSRYHNEATLVHGKLNPCLRSSFEFLTNVMNVTEGRTCFYKANMFHFFQQVVTLSNTGNKSQRQISKLLVFNWLKLFAVVSFHSDGAKHISKIQGMTRLLLDISTEVPKMKRRQESVLLIFRNLMFISASKQMLCSSKDVINHMLEILSSKSLKLKLLAMSFFSLMLYDNQKGKGSLNKIGLHKRLLSIQEDVRSGKDLSQDGDLQSHSRLVSMLENAIALLQN